MGPCHLDHITLYPSSRRLSVLHCLTILVNILFQTPSKALLLLVIFFISKAVSRIFFAMGFAISGQRVSPFCEYVPY
jgi:hypothetical protein